MNQYLKSYQVVMRTIGPVFVGSGRKIEKKEYLFLNRRRVGIPDIPLLYAELQKRKKTDAFEEYLLGKGKISLTQWLENQQICPADLDGLMKYTLDCGDAVLDKGANKLQILECIKDAYGMPYIPGSSLKGMLRTVLLGADILKNSGKYQRQKSSLRQNADNPTGNANGRINRMTYLKQDIADIEGVAFRTLNRPDSRPQDAVNDMLQGLIVSDSEPLLTDDLVLCQKIDRHPDGEENPLPILRECIKPNTEIRFTITVDTSVCSLSEKQLMEAVKLFMVGYHQNFASAFKGMDALKTNYVLCGGGCGFVSKTVVYPLYGKQEGIGWVQRVFDKTGVPREHKHNRDRQYGVSPHAIKCTKHKGKLLQMGVCSIEKIEEV